MLYMVAETFFIYTHTFSTGVMYVGKGVYKRAFKLATSRANSPYWLRLFRVHGPPTVALVAGPMDEELSLLCEQMYIAKLRTLGIVLCNLTDGGDGVSGSVRTADQNKKNSALRKAYYLDNPAAREANSARLTAYNRQPEVIARNVLRLSALAKSPGERAKRIATLLTTTATAEYRQNMSTAQREAWRNPDIRAKFMRGIATRDSSKIAPAMKLLYADKNNHPRTDHTQYIFTHTSGLRFTGKRIDLCSAHGVNASQLTAVIRGRYKSTQGWSFTGVST